MKSALKRKDFFIPIRHFRAIVREHRLSHGGYRLYMAMKARAEHDMCIVKIETLALDLNCTRRQIFRLINELLTLRLISVQNRSSRGNMLASAYHINDRFFARTLARRPKKDRCQKCHPSTSCTPDVPPVFSVVPKAA